MAFVWYTKCHLRDEWPYIDLKGYNLNEKGTYTEFTIFVGDLSRCAIKPLSNLTKILRTNLILNLAWRGQKLRGLFCGDL